MPFFEGSPMHQLKGFGRPIMKIVESIPQHKTLLCLPKSGIPGQRARRRRRKRKGNP
jgi:hypothetical protein